MKLRTEISRPVFDFKLDHRSPIVTLGSCFSEVVGKYLMERKFKVNSNPFGAVYNLKSLYGAVQTAIAGVPPSGSRVVHRDGLFFHLDYHSDFRHTTAAGLLQMVQEAGTGLRSFLEKADLLIVTLGTSWVYSFEDEIVSNCHKLPAAQFSRHLLGLDEQRELLRLLVEQVRLVNAGLRLMFTVSPVRHIKDGIAENSLSKALLRVLCAEATNTCIEIYYFPSFEVMMDDLRDYRFYKADLIHPDEVAEKYICDLFMEGIMTVEARTLSEAWTKVCVALQHRPLAPESDSHRPFLQALMSRMESFEKHFDVSKEREDVCRRLTALDFQAQG